MKVHPSLHSIFEITRSGFIQFLHHCSVSLEVTPLYYFSSKLIYFGRKEPIEVTFSDFWVVGCTFKFLMSHLKPQVCSNQNSPNWEYKLVFLQTLHHPSYCLRWSYIWFGQKSDAKFEKRKQKNSKKQIVCCFKNAKNLVMIRALKTLSNLHFDWSLICKVCNISPKKYSGFIFHDNWRVMRNLKRNWFVVWKMTWEIWQFFPRTLGSVKIRTLTGYFCPK